MAAYETALHCLSHLRLGEKEKALVTAVLRGERHGASIGPDCAIRINHKGLKLPPRYLTCHICFSFLGCCCCLIHHSCRGRSGLSMKYGGARWRNNREINGYGSAARYGGECVCRAFMQTGEGLLDLCWDFGLLQQSCNCVPRRIVPTRNVSRPRKGAVSSCPQMGAAVLSGRYRVRV